MLTSLKVNGFKNLLDVQIRFGTFTCIAGANGVGKSNLFDAIRFLSALADKTLLEAASSVRTETEKAPDVRGLFNRVGDKFSDVMRFEAEMIVPSSSIDDLGKEGKAKTTILRYILQLKYRTQTSSSTQRYGGDLEIIHEELTYIQKGEARKHFKFDHSKEWRESAVIGASRSPFISTVPGDEQERIIIKLHQDGNKGKPSSHVASSLPRTVLSSGSASESPTVLCARREMASWKLLQLEPSALRKPSEFNSPTQLSADGNFLASTLYHMARTLPNENIFHDVDAVYCNISNRLSELIGHVDSLKVDLDEKRELFTVLLKETSGTELPARALSDGTLRFLALAVLEMNSLSGGLICLEEPENGIHPARIPAMLNLLQDIATDAQEPIDSGNPLRQVIVNTHSPAVVSEVPDDSLLIAEAVETKIGDQWGTKVQFACLDETWRVDPSDATPIVAKSKLLNYLNPRSISYEFMEEMTNNRHKSKRNGIISSSRPQKVRDRKDIQMLLPFEEKPCQ